MPSIPYVISGTVKNSNSSLLESITITVLDDTTGESHNGSEDGYEDLISNVAGEWQTNLGNFSSYSDGDTITISAKATQGEDTEVIIVVLANGGESDISLVLVSSSVNRFNTDINDHGERMDKRRMTTVYTTDYGSIDSETPVDSTITAFQQVDEDERKLVDWGEIKEGEGLGFFKIKDAMIKGDLVRFPITSGKWWRVQNTPITYRDKGEDHHYEARLILLDGSEETVSETEGTVTETIDVSVTPQTENFTGAEATGSDDSENRVITLSNSSLSQNESIIVSGQGQTINTDYTISHLATNTTVTFLRPISNADLIGVRYFS